MVAVMVDGLRKDYGELAAVDGLSFTIDEGEVFALLGPNGAGKTTTVEILEGHRHRTAGEVRVLGFDPQTGGRAMRERIGIVLQEAGFDEDFTVHELVRLYRGMYPRRLDADAVIDQVGLTDKRDTRVKTLSGGQRRRLDLALGLVGDPELLFLDEPTTGFDPSARRRAWTLIEGLRDLGKTVLLTTHYMDEAEHLADRVAVVVNGHLVALGTPGDLGAGARSTVVEFRLPPGTDTRDLPTLPGELAADGLDWHLTTETPTAALHTITGWALRAGIEVPSLTARRPSLEDVYLDLVDEELGDEELGDDDLDDEGLADETPDTRVQVNDEEHIDEDAPAAPQHAGDGAPSRPAPRTRPSRPTRSATPSPPSPPSTPEHRTLPARSGRTRP